MCSRPLRTLAATLCAAASAAGAQAAAQAPAGGLTPALRAHVQNGRFDVVSTIRGLPLGVRGELQTLFGGRAWDMAEPGEPFQGSSATADTTLPSRRLVAAGCSYEDCLVFYERGAGSARTRRVVLFHWTPDMTRFEWGGTLPPGLKTIDDVRRVVLAGAARPTTGPW